MRERPERLIRMWIRRRRARGPWGVGVWSWGRHLEWGETQGSQLKRGFQVINYWEIYHGILLKKNYDLNLKMKTIQA